MEFRTKKLNFECRLVLTVMQLKNSVPQTNGKKCLSVELFLQDELKKNIMQTIQSDSQTNDTTTWCLF